MKKLVVVLAFILCLGLGTAFAGTGLDVGLTCPQTASYSGGSGKIYVSATVTNWNCFQVPLHRTITGLMGNGQQGGASVPTIFGPFPHWIAITNVPAADCGGTGTPGQVTINGIYVADVPVEMENTMAMATVMFTDPNGSQMAGNMCMVAIRP